MRLALVIPSFYPAVVYGGPVFASLHASQALAESGVDVYVSTTDANGQKRLDVETGRFTLLQERLHVKYYQETIVGRASLSMLFFLWQDLRDADIVHAQSIFSLPTPITLFYAGILNKKVLLSPRGSLCGWCLKEKTSFKRKWLKLLIDPFVKNVVWHATSPQEKEDIANLYPDADIRLIPDGIDYNAFQSHRSLSKEEFVKRYGGKNLKPEKIIVTMARIHKVKGLDVLIEAFALVRKTYPKALLFIAGKDDGDLARLQALTEKLGVRDQVFFTGALYDQEKIDFLANADLFVLPSHTENFGIAYAESLACGTPIVASDKTPWKDVEKAGCGRWVPNLPRQTADAMTALLQEDRQLLSRRARAFVRRFDWRAIAKEYTKLFQTMLEQER